tara:strand:+ start:245 stop:529 length:285 start_codon:yes stop_codon:yes gene_type:complete
MEKTISILFKAFWGKGKKPSLFSIESAGVGNQVNVRGATLADKAVVKEALNAEFAKRPTLKYGDLQYDSEYSTFTAPVLQAGRSGTQYVINSEE